MNSFRPLHPLRRRAPAALLLLLATALRAADTSSAPPAGASTQLPPVMVTASTSTPLTVPAPDQARATLALTPGGAGVVDAETYLRGRASTVADTFALAAGVFAQPRFGSDEARLSIRGSGIQRTFHGRGLIVMQDGVPINLADGGFDMQSLEPLATNYIEVLRGGNALATGAAALGGSINYVSRTGRDATPGLARVEAGSFGYLRGLVADGTAAGAFDAYAAFTATKQGGFRDHAEQENQRLLANIGWRISPVAESRLYLAAVHTDSQLPGSLTKAELNANPAQADKSFFGSVRFNNRRDYDLLRLADQTTVLLGAEGRFDFALAWTYKDLDHPITPFVGVIDQLSNDLLASATYTGGVEALGLAHRVRVGVQLSRGETNAAIFANVLGARGALTSDADQTATNLMAFAEDQVALGYGLTFVAAANYAHNTLKNTQRVGATPTFERDYDRLSPKLGLRWDTAGLQLYANVSGSYEPPTFSETGGTTPNRAQTATTFEVGSRGVRHFFRWDASLYSAAVRNEFLDMVSATNVPLGTINAARTTHRGVELAVEADILGQDWDAKTAPGDRLVLRVNWIYGQFKFDGDPVFGNNTLAGLPPHMIRGELMWENSAGWYAGPNFEWVPSRTFVDHMNTFAADPYAIAGFRVGRRLGKGASWFLEVRNVFNTTYAATTGATANAAGADVRQFLPGDGRGFFGGVEFRW